MLSSKETVRNFIQKRIFSELGLETSVSISEETGDVVVKRLLKVCKNSSTANQISLDDARMINPKVKVMDYIEVDLEPNLMVEAIINQAISESGKAEQEIRRRQELIDSLKVEGISENSLIFPVFESETALGDANFRLDGKYRVFLTADRRIPGEKFTIGRDYPMIVMSIEKRKEDIILQASRVTSILVGELIRMSLIDSSVKITINKSARLPGRMSKVIVSCDNPNLNATGVVVGNKGLRITSVEKYLNGEKVEIVNYEPSTPMQIMQLIGADRLSEMHFYFEDPEYFSTMRTLNKKKILIIVRNDKVGQVVGKGGMSLQLTNKISGWVMRVITDSEYEEKMEAINYTAPFDWMGVDFGYPFINNFYGYYLHELGHSSVLDLVGLEVSDYEKCKYFTEGDAQFLHNVISGLEFSYKCPSCGEDISPNVSVCPHCGAEFSQE